MFWASALPVLVLAAAPMIVHGADNPKAVQKSSSKAAKAPAAQNAKSAASKRTVAARSGGNASHTTLTQRLARRRPHLPPAPSYQLHPDPERYQEIQKALADRGYFKGEVNGVWGDDSVDALTRFQADQKLTPDGKISALTLIGLGLGPKHDGTAVASSLGNASSIPSGEPPPAPTSLPPTSDVPAPSPPSTQRK